MVPEVVRDGLDLEGSVEFRLVLYGLQDDVSPRDGHIDWIGWRGKVRSGVSYFCEGQRAVCPNESAVT